MKRFMKTFDMLLAMMAVSMLALPMTSYAYEYIDRVKLDLVVSDYDEFGHVEVEAKENSRHFSTSIVPADSYDWDEEKVPERMDNRFVAELSADDDYYFRTTKLKDVSIKGYGADVVSAARRDNGKTFFIVFELKDLDAYLGEVEDTTWDGCRLSWNDVPGAKSYKVMITGKKTTFAETLGTSYDCSPLFQKEGEYTVKVRAIGDGTQSEWYEDSITVSREDAAKNESAYEVKTEITYDGDPCPANRKVRTLNTGWQKSDKGWWYRENDGTYPQMTWKQMGDAWYYFDENGYMVTGEKEILGVTYQFHEDGTWINK